MRDDNLFENSKQTLKHSAKLTWLSIVGDAGTIWLPSDIHEGPTLVGVSCHDMNGSSTGLKLAVAACVFKNTFRCTRNNHCPLFSLRLPTRAFMQTSQVIPSYLPMNTPKNRDTPTCNRVKYATCLSNIARIKKIGDISQVCCWAYNFSSGPATLWKLQNNCPKHVWANLQTSMPNITIHYLFILHRGEVRWRHGVGISPAPFHRSFLLWPADSVVHVQDTFHPIQRHLLSDSGTDAEDVWGIALFATTGGSWGYPLTWRDLYIHGSLANRRDLLALLPTEFTSFHFHYQ